MLSKLATHRLAFVEDLVSKPLTLLEHSAFIHLATFILNARSGKWTNATSLSQILPALARIRPDFTTPVYALERFLLADLIVENKIRPTTKTAPVATMRTLPIGTYYCGSSPDPKELRKVFLQTKVLGAADVVCVFKLPEQPGFQFEQLRTLLLNNASVLVAAASQLKQPSPLATLKSLNRALLKTPTLAIMHNTQPLKLNFANLVGAFDTTTSDQATFYPHNRFSQLLIELRKHWADKVAPAQPGQKNRFEQFQKKQFFAVGLPPSGWSTDRFNKLLTPFGSSCSTTLDYDTRGVIYNPDTIDPDQLAQFKARKTFTVLTYEQAIASLAAS